MPTVNDFLGAAGSVLPLFISGGIDGPPMIFSDPLPSSANKNLPLFVEGLGYWARRLALVTKGYLGNYKKLNLYIGGRGNDLSAMLPLFLYNTQAAGILPLYIAGEGVMEGALPYNKKLNLFIKRAPTAWLSLILQNPGHTDSEILPLFIKGSGFTTNTLFLSIPNVSVLLSKTLPLYIHGF